jgi:endonuclease/exonuclease/phosphatase family metal-dependent hydrolase
MNRRFIKTRWLLLGLVILTAGTVAGKDQDRAAAVVRVMSFNIRYGTARDGSNGWPHRRAAVLGVVRGFDADLLGTQETLAFQRDELLASLPAFAVVAAGRDDGREAGEMAALYYNRNRFEPLDSGQIWLSETPAIPGSRGWDAALPRIATWVKLRDRTAPQDKPLLFLNTHFDHVGANARLESAWLIRRSLAALGKGCRLVVTGDFNAAEASPPYAALFAEAAAAPRLLDTLRVMVPKPTGPEGTFNSFDPTSTAGPRIDWIGCSPDWRVVAAGIDHTVAAGRPPSDHWPVTAILAPRSRSQSAPEPLESSH